MNELIPTQRTKIGHPEQFTGPTLRVERMLGEPEPTPRPITISALVHSAFSDGTIGEAMPYAQQIRQPSPETHTNSECTTIDLPFTVYDQQLLQKRLAGPDSYPTRREIRQNERAEYARDHKVARLGYLAISSILRAVSKRS